MAAIYLIFLKFNLIYINQFTYMQSFVRHILSANSDISAYIKMSGSFVAYIFNLFYRRL